jgi:hypothetical protein
MNINKNQRLYLIIILFMLMVMIKCVSNIIFFRQIVLSILPSIQLTIASSAIIYPLFYIINDLILAITNKKIAIIIMIFATICNGIFASYISYIDLIPDNLPWLLFRNDIIGTLITNILELLLFGYIVTKIKNFFLSAFVSTALTLSTHNFIAYYFTLHKNNNWFNTYIDSLIVEIFVTVTYLVSIKLFMGIKSHKLIGEKCQNLTI